MFKILNEKEKYVPQLKIGDTRIATYPNILMRIKHFRREKT